MLGHGRSCTGLRFGVALTRGRVAFLQDFESSSVAVNLLFLEGSSRALLSVVVMSFGQGLLRDRYVSNSHLALLYLEG